MWKWLLIICTSSAVGDATCSILDIGFALMFVFCVVVGMIAIDRWWDRRKERKRVARLSDIEREAEKYR